MRRLLFVLAIGCGGSQPMTPPPADANPAADARPDAADRVPPEIVSTTPADDEGDRPVTQAFTAKFSEPIDPATVTDQTFFMFAGSRIAGTIAVTGDTATFTPAAPLDVSTRYSVTLAPPIADLAGNALVTDHTYRFNTVHRRRVFVTSIQNTGRLAGWPGANGRVGLAAADSVCQTRAVAANLDGTFVAWLSDDTHDAFCRVQGLPGTRAANCGQGAPPHDAGPWVRIDGQPWAATIDALTVFTPPLLEEHGLPSPAVYFSSSTATGAGTTNCVNWTSNGFGGVGYGGARTTGTYWTQWGTTTCASFASLLCVETGASAIALVFPPAGAKLAFVTSTAVTGNLGASADAGGATGVAAGDAICQTRAAAAGLANAPTFKAWLSDDTIAAPARIISNGPWARLDGIRIANSKLDLLDGQLATTPSQTETGAYLSDVQAWTNTTSAGAGALASCTGWTSDIGLGFAGRANDSGPHWTRDASADCASALRLYCFEDM